MLFTSLDVHNKTVLPNTEPHDQSDKDICRVGVCQQDIQIIIQSSQLIWWYKRVWICSSHVCMCSRAGGVRCSPLCVWVDVCTLALAAGGVSGAGGRWAVGLNRDWAGAERWQLRKGGVRGEERSVCWGGEWWRKTGAGWKWMICGGQKKCKSAA